MVESKLYKKNEVVKTIRTDIEGIASTSADLLPYGNFRIVESEAPDGYLTDGAKPIDFTITENGKIVDLTDEAHSIYNQIKRGDIEGVKIGAGTHKRLADVPFRIDVYKRQGVLPAGVAYATPATASPCRRLSLRTSPSRPALLVQESR